MSHRIYNEPSSQPLGNRGRWPGPQDRNDETRITLAYILRPDASSCLNYSNPYRVKNTCFSQLKMFPFFTFPVRTLKVLFINKCKIYRNCLFRYLFIYRNSFLIRCIFFRISVAFFPAFLVNSEFSRFDNKMAAVGIHKMAAKRLIFIKLEGETLMFKKSLVRH